MLASATVPLGAGTVNESFGQMNIADPGELTVLLPAEDRMLDLASGDRVELPAGMVHGTMAGADGAAYLLATR